LSAKLFSLMMLFIILWGGFAHAEVKVNTHPFLPSVPAIAADREGNVYVAYYSEDGHLYFKRNNEQETRISDQAGQGDFVDLVVLNNNDVVLIWRPKVGAQKHVYSQRSTDGGRTFSKPVVLNTADQALPPMHVVSDGTDRIYVVWVDERYNYNLYMNYSTDGGRTYREKDMNLTPDFKFTTTPRIVLDGDNVHLFFMGAKEGGRTAAYYMGSKDSGKNWSGIVKVKDMPTEWSPSALDAGKSRDTLLVVWAGALGMYGASSGDGREWKDLEFKETVGRDVNKPQVAADKKGDLFITASWATGAKPNVYLYRSEDGGLTWAAPVKLNTNEYDSTSSYLPVMKVRDDGVIVVAWQDHRNIRGNIRLTYSKDYGKTWLARDVNVEDAEGKLNSFLPSLANSGNTYYVLWIRYTDDTMEQRELSMGKYTIQ